MSRVILLRSASVVSGLLFAGHTLGMPWTPHGSTRGGGDHARGQVGRHDAPRAHRAVADFLRASTSSGSRAS